MNENPGILKSSMDETNFAKIEKLNNEIINNFISEYIEL